MATARYRMDENDLEPDNDEDCGCDCHNDDDPECCEKCAPEEPYGQDVPEDDNGPDLGPDNEETP